MLKVLKKMSLYMYYPKERNNYPKGKVEQNSTTQKAKNNYPKAAEYYPKEDNVDLCDAQLFAWRPLCNGYNGATLRVEAAL